VAQKFLKEGFGLPLKAGPESYGIALEIRFDFHTFLSSEK
jgi:hypothetical protein